MRKSQKEAARTRERIVETAAAEFRQKGVSGTGLADVMAAAGLTHGGFYRHFQSKDQLVSEACSLAIDSVTRLFETALSGGGERHAFQTMAAGYLSEQHRDDPSGGCPFAALGSELARADENTRAIATEGLSKILDLMVQHAPGLRADVAKRRAVVALSTMVGALTLARIVSDPKLSALLLAEAAKHVGVMAHGRARE
jgi:TetR/AcrR family transcriptional repressor of nem operon